MSQKLRFELFRAIPPAAVYLTITVGVAGSITTTESIIDEVYDITNVNIPVTVEIPGAIEIRHRTISETVVDKIDSI